MFHRMVVKRLRLGSLFLTPRRFVRPVFHLASLVPRFFPSGKRLGFTTDNDDILVAESLRDGVGDGHQLLFIQANGVALDQTGVV